MSQYYGIQRSDEYLAHYGIKGMKWGVQKAKDRGDQAALNKHYKKASIKLAKLSANANRGLQRTRFDNAKRNMAAGALTSGLGSAGLTYAINAGQPNVGKVSLITGGVGALAGGLMNSRGIMSGRHISDKGHARAIQKRNEFAREMSNAFKGTPYGGKKYQKFQQQMMAISDQKNPVAYLDKQARRAESNLQPHNRKRRH